MENSLHCHDFRENISSIPKFFGGNIFAEVFTVFLFLSIFYTDMLFIFLHKLFMFPISTFYIFLSSCRNIYSQS